MIVYFIYNEKEDKIFRSGMGRYCSGYMTRNRAEGIIKFNKKQYNFDFSDYKIVEIELK